MKVNRKNKVVIRACILAFGIGVCAPALAQSSEPQSARPDDFAGQMRMSGSEGDVMWLELPVNVYKHVERSDLGDIRVFDSGGLPVPFEIRRPEQLSITPDPVKVVFFPWQAEEKNLPGLPDIQIDASGAVIKVNNPARPAGGDGSSGQAALTGTVSEDIGSSSYLLDLGGLQYIPTALNLTFTDLEHDFNSSAEVRYSNDLASWQLFDKKQTLARLSDSDGKRRTEHFSIQMPQVTPRYLLLSLGKNTPPLFTVTAVFEPQIRPGEMRSNMLRGRKSENGMEVVYDTGGYFPLVAIDFILPNPDSLNVELKNRMSDKTPWAFKAEGDIYRFKPGTDGSERRSKPFEIRSFAPHWLLEATGGVPFANEPEMEIYWEPYKLVWLARGDGPWVIAYGNRDFGIAYDSNLSSLDNKLLVEAKIIGDEVYTPRPEPMEEAESGYQQWALWAVLVLAVGILSGLAYVVAKGMSKKPE